LQLIESNIKGIIENYFAGWPSIESSVLQIIMRVNDVYKTPTSVVFDKDDDRNKHSDLVDLEKYKIFEKYRFKQKIDNLLENKIIGESTYKFLDYLRIKRNNKIHGTNPHFSDEDREWFEVGYSVIHYVNVALYEKSNIQLKNQMMESAENTSKLILEKINQKEIS